MDLVIVYRTMDLVSPGRSMDITTLRQSVNSGRLFAFVCYCRTMTQQHYGRLEMSRVSLCMTIVFVYSSRTIDSATLWQTGIELRKFITKQCVAIFYKTVAMVVP